MGIGVTENELFAAADAVLARGERPTYERVRAELGRGSPARIGALLETWWTQLAQRLAQQLAMPALPTEVSAAVAQLWEAALAAGRAHAESLVAPERAALADVVAKADDQVAGARHQVADLEARLQRSEAQSADHYREWRLSEQQVVQLGRDHATLQAAVQELSVRRDALEARVTYLQAQAETERAAAATEREAIQRHARQVEDRALAEVDRVRTELKQARAEAERQTKAQTAERASLTKARDAALAAQHAAEGRAEAAEAMLKVFRAGMTKSPPPRPRDPGQPTPRANPRRAARAPKRVDKKPGRHP
jgi:hypothetical protein